MPISDNFSEKIGLNKKRQKSGTLSYVSFCFSLSTVVLHAIYNFPLLTIHNCHVLSNFQIVVNFFLREKLSSVSFKSL